MDQGKKLKMLQMFYAGALADSVLRMGKGGILEKVTAEKKAEQMATGAMRAQQLGIQTPEEVFSVLPEIFECANWKVSTNTTGFTAEATQCTLCAMAKKMGAMSPCQIYCLDAMEGMVKGLSPQAEYLVESTLWTGQNCQVRVIRND